MADTAKSSRIDRLCDDIEETIAKLHDQVRTLRSAVAGENTVGKAIAYWQASWKGRYRADYDLTKADAGNLKRLVTKHGLGELCARLNRYLHDRDDFLERQKHPLSIFFSRVNTYASPIAGAGPFDVDTEMEPPPDCRHAPPCRSDQEHTRKRAAERRA